jgi:RNA polymerase sigma-70 factor (ECF subfamily)
MDPEKLDQPLSRISTLWDVVSRAHEGPPGAAAAAQEELLRRYGPGIRRYLLGALRDADAAEELAQEFALRFVRGDLRGADPGRGRFRDYVRGVLRHLIADHHRRWRPALPLSSEPAAPADDPADLGPSFTASWRDALLDRTWEALAEVERRTGQPFHTVLRLRADQPDLRSPQLAERLAATLGRPVSAAALRQTLHRAREKFVDLLLAEVLHTLRPPTAELLEEELVDLGLLEYCQAALKRFRADS